MYLRGFGRKRKRPKGLLLCSWNYYFCPAASGLACAIYETNCYDWWAPFFKLLFFCTLELQQKKLIQRKRRERQIFLGKMQNCLSSLLFFALGPLRIWSRAKCKETRVFQQCCRRCTRRICLSLSAKQKETHLVEEADYDRQVRSPLHSGP